MATILQKIAEIESEVNLHFITIKSPMYIP